MRGLEGKVVVIAGGASGIGAASARRLGAEGAHVVVGDVDAAGAGATADAIVAAGGRAVPWAFDLADPASCRELIAAAVAEFGGLDGLYNVGADFSEQTMGRDTNLLEMPIEVWDRTLAVNLTGYFHTARAAVPELLARGGGSIVSMTSAGASGDAPLYLAYGVSKAGIVTLMRHIARTWGEQGIRSNAISPGMVLTEAGLRVTNEEQRTAYLAMTRSFRLGVPEDTAAMVAFLMSDDAAWFNGQVFAASSMDG